MHCPYCGAPFDPVEGVFCNHFIGTDDEGLDGIAYALGVVYAEKLSSLSNAEALLELDEHQAPDELREVLKEAIAGPHFWPSMIELPEERVFIDRPCFSQIYTNYFADPEDAELRARVDLLDARCREALSWLYAWALATGDAALLEGMLDADAVRPTEADLLRVAAEDDAALLEAFANWNPAWMKELARQTQSAGQEHLHARLAAALS